MASAAGIVGRNVTYGNPAGEVSSQFGMMWHHFTAGGSFEVEWRRDCVMIWLRQAKNDERANLQLR